jgi:hypothetical protein
VDAVKTGELWLPFWRTYWYVFDGDRTTDDEAGEAVMGGHWLQQGRAAGEEEESLAFLDRKRSVCAWLFVCWLAGCQ